MAHSQYIKMCEDTVGQTHIILKFSKENVKQTNNIFKFVKIL